MKIEEHMAKAERFVESMKKLDSVADYEAIMWARMHICSNWINTALHAKGITPEADDVAHTWYLFDYKDNAFLEAHVDEETRDALTQLAIFESLRTTHVRGSGPYGSDIGKLSDKAYQHLKEFTEKAISSMSPGAPG